MQETNDGMQKFYNALAIAGVVGFIVLAFFFKAPSLINTANRLPGGSVSVPAFDLFGSTSGTSTTGVSGMTSPVAKTQVVKLIGEDVNAFDINLLSIAASSTATVTVQVEQSNDLACDTTATTGDSILANQIRWYDVVPQIDQVLVNPYSVVIGGNTTTTYSWVPVTSGRGTTIHLLDLNTRCLRFTLYAPSSTIYAQGKAKSNNY